MDSGQNKTRWFVWVGVAFLQLIMTQVVTFLFSMFIPNVEQFQKTSPVGFALIAGFSFSVGAFLPGWLAFKTGWLKGSPKLPVRLIFTFLGAYIPLAIGLLVYGTIEAGNPFLAVSIVFSILGFHLPGWIARE
jgi:hypothetical protein